MAGEKQIFVEFEGYGDGVARLYTNSHEKALQNAIEGSDRFKKGEITLESATNKDDEDTSEKGGIQLQEVRGINTMQDAAHYLADNFGMDINELKNKNIIKGRAKTVGISFPEL
jgi:hypothetical protein